MLTEYFLKHHKHEIIEILDAPEQHAQYAIYVNFLDLFEADVDSANKLRHRPREYLPRCDESAIKAQQLIVTAEQTVKQRVKTRITGVPLNVNEGLIGELVSTTGITVRISQPTVLKLIERYKCRKCEYVTVLKLDWERQAFEETKECGACVAPTISLLPSLQYEDSGDYQEIKIQEKCDTDSKNSYTEGLEVILMDDLVDKCRPGDLVDICGVIIRRWDLFEEGERMIATTIMIANSISVRRKITQSKFSSNEIQDIFQSYWDRYRDNPLVGRDNIVASISPQLFGMYVVKLALALVLAGGVTKTNNTGSRIRGESHLLLVGDPGTGKSQLLRAASRLAVRSVLTTGVGTTAAGLTAAAVKDADGWHLEGGALVLADGGVCCVDEFTTMSSEDRASLHEAMEQQTISIAKAGLVSTLNSRCSVVAAINPDGGNFVEGEEMKTSLGDPLLSRFDLILLLKDNKNREWDRMMTDHILRAACSRNVDAQSKMDLKKPMDLLKSDGIWKEESLREYLAYVHSIKPVLTREAEKVLSTVFLYHRSNPDRREERTTVRLLDSLVRRRSRTIDV
ncbi:DNA helicase MCM9-like isoform X2 [Venturia canescens]|uniref:DNA helicase MCM9-like isoform X2 n=1 Tax=Venturia canescens TaxID=32260 RepID=UPI001C9BE3EB|nr:DNA helicase MCM9-like isoform X2 [Venturia canescens]